MQVGIGREPIRLVDGSCILCQAPQPRLLGDYETFHRVTSDCKPWPPGGHLCICGTCQGVQVVPDSQWEADVAEIYANYSIYYQSSGGAEQMVFDSSGQGSERSARVLSRMAELDLLADAGRALDIGSGNGALLRALSVIRPAWSLAASDVTDRFRDVVEGIPRVEQLYTCAPHLIPGEFDLITLIHALEHSPKPVDLLMSVRRKLAPGGLLLVQVPDATRSPFDLLVADHCTHFSEHVLNSVVRRAGYEVVQLRTDWVAKELSLVARVVGSSASTSDHTGRTAQLEALTWTLKHLRWLRSVSHQARECAALQPFGIFGTSIAGAWLFAELSGAAQFFVDEDPSRVGGTYMGRPIYHPRDVPAGSHVFIGLAPVLAEQIRLRFSKQPEFAFHVHVPETAASESELVEYP